MRGWHGDVAISGNATLEAMTLEASDGTCLCGSDAEEQGVVDGCVPALLEAVQPFCRESRGWRQVLLLKFDVMRFGIGSLAVSQLARWNSFEEDVVDGVKGGSAIAILGIVVEMQLRHGFVEVVRHLGLYACARCECSNIRGKG